MFEPSLFVMTRLPLRKFFIKLGVLHCIGSGRVLPRVPGSERGDGGTAPDPARPGHQLRHPAPAPADRPRGPAAAGPRRPRGLHQASC